MSVELSQLVLALFLIFCRVGTCLLLMPGFSSSPIPMRIRLFVAIALALALSPTILPSLLPLVARSGDNAELSLIATEILNGLFIGLLGRSFMIALQFAGHVIANSIGMAQMVGTPIADRDPMPAIGTLVTMTATTLIFVLNLHAEIARALIASYSAIPVAAGFSASRVLTDITDNLDEAFLLCLRISSPFVLYGVIVNFAIGLANKLTPTIPIYFISLPFVLAGGLILFGYTVSDMLTIFIDNFANWVANG